MLKNVMTVEATHKTEIASTEKGDIFSLHEATACNVISCRGAKKGECPEQESKSVRLFVLNTLMRSH